MGHGSAFLIQIQVGQALGAGLPTPPPSVQRFLYCARRGLPTPPPSAFLIQVQVGPTANESKDLADLLETGPKEEMGIAAITLGPEDEKARLGVLEGAGTQGGHGQAIGAGMFEQGGRQVHGAKRG